MSKREALALILCKEDNGDDACKENCIHPENNSFCPYGFVVDKLLDELMEPGEGALHAGDDAGIDELTSAGEVWQVVLTAIREGK